MPIFQPTSGHAVVTQSDVTVEITVVVLILSKSQNERRIVFELAQAHPDLPRTSLRIGQFCKRPDAVETDYSCFYIPLVSR